MSDCEKKLTTTNSSDPEEKKVPKLHFFLSAGTTYETSGLDHTVINT